MDGSKNTVAIILDRQDYREQDSLITVYSPDYGKLKLLARGTKKLHSKLAGHLEPLILANLMIIPGKGFDYIGSALNQESYPGLRADLNKLYYAGQVVQTFNRLVKGEEADSQLFFLLADWLGLLETSSAFDQERGELFKSFFVWKLLAGLGYRPEMYKCLHCQTTIAPGNNYFHLLQGGLLCGACLEQERLRPDFIANNLLTISDNCVKIIRFMLENHINNMSKVKVEHKLNKELSNITTFYLNCYFEL